MTEERPLPPPADPWADATAAEELTPQIIYTSGQDADPDETDIRDAVGNGGAEPGTGARDDAVRRVRPADPPYRERPALPSGATARRGGRAVIVLVAVVSAILLTGVGVAVGQRMSRHDTAGGPSHGPNVGANVGGPSAGGVSPAGTPSVSDGPASASQDPSPAASGPSPVDSARPTQPDQALKLTDAQATAELNLEADENKKALAALAGHWVPQVDGKCAGLEVDIQPSWQPDGTPDTPHVTVQQILGFHLELELRFHALTARPSQLGQSLATTGQCVGHDQWFSVVATTFDTDTAANAWCDKAKLPLDECLARYVPKPGETAKTTDRH